MNFNDLHNRQQLLERAYESFDDFVSDEDKWYPNSVTTFAAASDSSAPLVKWDNPHLYLNFTPLRPIPKAITVRFSLNGITAAMNLFWAVGIINPTTLTTWKYLLYATKSGGITAAGANNGVYNQYPYPDKGLTKTFVTACTSGGMAVVTSYPGALLEANNWGPGFKLVVQAWKSFPAGTVNGVSYPGGNYNYWLRLRDLWLDF